MAAEYLISKGHRRCGFVGDTDLPDYAIRTSDMRLDSYRQALEGAGLSLPDAYVGLAPHGMEQARQQAHRLLDLPEPPTAIFAPSDTQAMGVLKAARERGVSVPRDVAVIGFDDVEIADYIGLTPLKGVWGRRFVNSWRNRAVWPLNCYWPGWPTARALSNMSSYPSPLCREKPPEPAS